MTDNDAVIGPYTHTIFLNVYHPELHYYIIGYKLYSLPFVNTDALTDYSQLDSYENLWYICFRVGHPMNWKTNMTTRKRWNSIICIMIL